MKLVFQIIKTDKEDELINHVVYKIEQEYSTNKKIAILVAKNLAQIIDSRLWFEGKNKFIPHFCAIQSSDYNSFKEIPVLITDNAFLLSGFDKVINLMSIVINPDKILLSELNEIVYQQPRSLINSRKKYIFYKKAGLNIETVTYM